MANKTRNKHQQEAMDRRAENQKKYHRNFEGKQYVVFQEVENGANLFKKVPRTEGPQLLARVDKNSEHPAVFQGLDDLDSIYELYLVAENELPSNGQDIQ